MLDESFSNPNRNPKGW